MKLQRATYWSIVIIFFLVIAINAEEPKREQAKNMCSVDEIRGFLRKNTIDQINKTIQRWQKCPLYLKPAILEALAEYLTSVEICEIRDYSYEKNSHDLNCAAERAALAFEKLMGIELIKINQTISKDAQQNIRDEAEKLIKAYNAGIIAMSGEIKHEKSIDELTKSYIGKIKHKKQTNDYEKSFNLMSELFLDWFPIGKKLSDLENIMGSIGIKRDDGSVEYNFENGWAGVQYRLKTVSGIIVSVSIIGME
jgi:hypothetical protein